MARKRLLARMFELEREHAASGRYDSETRQQEVRLSQIYSYAYNESLTGCVEQVNQMEKYTKLIVGEQGYVFHQTFGCFSWDFLLIKITYCSFEGAVDVMQEG